jgi:hypothetical protein
MVDAGNLLWLWFAWLPLPGAGVTFFAAAKKVTKESSFSGPRHEEVAALDTP